MFDNLQEKFEWIEEPVDKKIKQGSLDEVTFSAKLSHKGKKAKWYMRNQVRTIRIQKYFSQAEQFFHPFSQHSVPKVHFLSKNSNWQKHNKKVNLDFWIFPRLNISKSYFFLDEKNNWILGTI